MSASNNQINTNSGYNGYVPGSSYFKTISEENKESSLFSVQMLMKQNQLLVETKRNSHGINKEWARVFKIKWEVIPNEGFDPLRLQNDMQNMLSCYQVNVIASDYFKKLSKFREAIQFIKKSPYYNLFGGETSLRLRFDGLKNPEAIALIFRFKQYTKIFSPSDIQALYKLKSTCQEVADVVDCLISANDFYHFGRQIRVINKLVGVVGFVNETFATEKVKNKEVVKYDGKVKSFHGDSFVVFINRVNEYILSYYERCNENKLDVFDLFKYPPKKELDEILLDISTWEKGLPDFFKEFSNTYETLQSQRNRLKGERRIEFEREYFKYSLSVTDDLKKEFTYFAFDDFNRECKNRISPVKPAEELIVVKKQKSKKTKGKKVSKPNCKKEMPEKSKTVECQAVQTKEIKEQVECNSSGSTERIPALPVCVNLKLKYSARVIDWFGSAPSKLNDPSYRVLSVFQQRLQHLFHGYSQLVDQFITSYSFKGTWINKTDSGVDSTYRIPGEIHVSQRRYQGLFTYCIGERNAECYHRYFTPKSNKEFMQYVNASHFTKETSLEEEIDYSALGENSEVIDSLSEKDAYEVNPHSKLVTIKDAKHQATIYLYCSEELINS